MSFALKFPVKRTKKLSEVNSMASQLLSNIYLFKGLPAEEVNALTKLVEYDKIKAGQNLFSEGDKATALFVVKYGTVKIVHSSPHGEEINVANLGTGSHFGEMAFVHGKPRTGSATAVEDCELLRIDYDKLTSHFEKNPKLAAHFYRSVAQFLCGRLENTTRDLTFAREKKLKAA